jgi:anti-sigma regulatory factor (Ser/Thr protein kinase)
MDTMAPTRTAPVIHPARHLTLAARPAAAAAARRQVQAAIHAWDIPVDQSVATLLASELVANVLVHDAGDSIRLVISRTASMLRVDVHDTSCDLPVLGNAPATAEAGRGLQLVSSLSAMWGYYRTPMGKAVYFTLAFQADPGAGDGRRHRCERSGVR